MRGIISWNYAVYGRDDSKISLALIERSDFCCTRGLHDVVRARDESADGQFVRTASKLYVPYGWLKIATNGVRGTCRPSKGRRTSRNTHTHPYTLLRPSARSAVVIRGIALTRRVMPCSDDCCVRPHFAKFCRNLKESRLDVIVSHLNCFETALGACRSHSYKDKLPHTPGVRLGRRLEESTTIRSGTCFEAANRQGEKKLS